MSRQFSHYFAQLNAEFEHKADGRIQTEAYLDALGYPTGPAGVRWHADGRPVQLGDTWTEAEAFALYALKASDLAAAVEPLVPPAVRADDYWFDALGILSWNLGTGAVDNSSILDRLDQQPPRLEEAASRMLLYCKGRLRGGDLGPDGTPARGYDGQVMPAGVYWFKAFRGLLRRQAATALLALGYDWHAATAPELIDMEVETVWQDDHQRWYDRVVSHTPWPEILDRAKQAPRLGPPIFMGRPPPPVVAKEDVPLAPEPGNRESACASEAKHPPVPYQDYDPGAPEKHVAFSKRVWGFLATVVGWFVTGTYAVSEFLAGVPFVQQVAAMSPLKVGDWKIGLMILMAGLLLTWVGQVKAKGPLK